MQLSFQSLSCDKFDVRMASRIVPLSLWRPLGFRDFRRKKTPKHMWLCAGISLVRYALQTR